MDLGTRLDGLKESSTKALPTHQYATPHTPPTALPVWSLSANEYLAVKSF